MLLLLLTRYNNPHCKLPYSHILHVFQLNTELYPESYNVYDSYGEALLKNGDRDKAIKNYRQSLILNPDSQSGKRVLQEIGVEM